MGNLTATWVLVGVGAAIWFLGIVVGSRRTRDLRPSHADRFLTRFGLVVLCLGLYAGLRGPLTLGPVTLRKFSFVEGVRKTAEEACAYARGNLVLSSRPAPGWRKDSDKVLQVTVENRGKRTIAWAMLRFTAKAGSKTPSLDLKLRGPFRARQTKRCALNIPASVDRAYFEGTSVTAGQIVDARF